MRLTARALLVNKNTSKILLIKYIDTQSKSTSDLLDGFWTMPGGGVEENEGFVDTIRREIYEETGIAKIDIKNCVMGRNIRLDISDMEDESFYERYYLVLTEEEEVNTDRLTPREIETIVEYRWWSVEEIYTTSDIIYPTNLSSVIKEALQNPSNPIDITTVRELF